MSTGVCAFRPEKTAPPTPMTSSSTASPFPLPAWFWWTCTTSASPATQSAALFSGDPTTYLSWLGSGTKAVHFSVSAVLSVDPSTSYTVEFEKTTGANDGLVSVLSPSRLALSWATVGLSGGDGFKVYRKTLLDPGFTQVTGSLIPLPGSPGTCPGPGCMEYEDTGLAPATIYFYRVDLQETPTSSVDWTGTFYGYTDPGAVPVTISVLSIE